MSLTLNFRTFSPKFKNERTIKISLHLPELL